MQIPTEPIGSIPRPPYLLDAMNGAASGELQAATDRALRETIDLFEATGSPVISDGEQSKPSFATLSGIAKRPRRQARQLTGVAVPVLC